MRAGIYPLQNVYIRKVKVLKAPKFDLTKLMEVSSAMSTISVEASGGLRAGTGQRTGRGKEQAGNEGEGQVGTKDSIGYSLVGAKGRRGRGEAQPLGEEMLG